MEKLYELHAEDRYDLLVLDTPPSRNALDFLDAPDRLLQFIDGRALQVFMRPTGLGMRVFGRGASMMFSVLRRITGVDLIEDLAEFFQAFGGMVGGFRERARKRQRAARRRADDIPGRLRARRASRSRRPSTSTASSIEARDAVRRGDRQQGPLRGATVERADRARAELWRSCWATRSSPSARRRELRRLPRARRRATARNIDRLAAELGSPARDRGPVPRPRRPRPRRADRGQPLPVRVRQRRAGRDRRPRSERPDRPKPPGVSPGGSTCSSWGDRRKSTGVTRARRLRS